MSLWRQPDLAVAVAAFATAVLIVALAVADHRRTHARSHLADVAGWFCEHRGTRCDDLQPTELETRWEVRERSYEAVFGIVLAISIVRGTQAVRRRRS